MLEIHNLFDLPFTRNKKNKKTKVAWPKEILRNLNAVQINSSRCHLRVLYVKKYQISTEVARGNFIPTNMSENRFN